MRLSQLIERFDARNIAGQLAQQPDGTPRVIGRNQRNVIVSHVTAAVRAAAGRDDEEDVGDVDLTPFLDILPEAAHRAAERTGLSKPANRASSVRTFLRAVEVRARAERKTKRRVRPESFLPGWLPLFMALQAAQANSERFRRYLGWLERLQQILMLSGIRSPEQLPDYGTTIRLLTEAGLREKERGDLLSAYRKARELAKRDDLSALERPPAQSHRGVKSLPDLKELVARGAVRRAGVARAQDPAAPSIAYPSDFNALATLDLVEYLAPQLAQATRAYLIYSETKDRKSEDWRNAVVSAVSATVAELVRLYVDPFDLDMVDLFLARREVAKTVTQTSEATKWLKRQDAVGATTHSLSLMRLVTDAGARHAYPESPIRVDAVHEGGTDVPYYPAALWNQLSALWSVTETIYGHELQMATANGDQWLKVKLEYEEIRAHMRLLNESRQPSGQKDKSLITLTWGEAVCVGLRQVWLECRALRTAWHVAYAGAEGSSGREHALRSPCVKATRSRYLKRLREYMLLALILDDGMRIKNYAKGRYGVNVIPLFERDSSGAVSVVRIRTRFRGWDTEAATKKRRKSGGRENIRTRLVLQSIVDMELVTDYILEARMDDLISARLLDDRAAYRPDDDNFAFFVSPLSTKTSGAYSTTQLSRRFGRLLHWISRDLLKHTDPDGHPLPTWREIRATGPAAKALRRKWRGLWGAHIVRQLIAVYIGHILDQWSLACERTNDKRSTLENFYVEFDGQVAEAMTKHGMQNPLHFKGVCLRLLRNEIIDWQRFDPARPDTSAIPMEGPIIVPPAVRSRRLMRHTGPRGAPALVG